MMVDQRMQALPPTVMTQAAAIQPTAEYPFTVRDSPTHSSAVVAAYVS